MLKAFGAGLLLVTGLAGYPNAAFALQTTVTQVDKNSDGSTTYRFAIKLDQGEALEPGNSKAQADFVTIYNFYGLVEGLVKSPTGWEFSSEEFGRTPTLNGYPMISPLDVPNTPNLTWAVMKPIGAGAQINGFAATTHVSAVVQGEYSAQLTRQQPAVQGAVSGTPAAAVRSAKQAVIGMLPSPSLLAPVK